MPGPFFLFQGMLKHHHQLGLWQRNPPCPKFFSVGSFPIAFLSPCPLRRSPPPPPPLPLPPFYKRCHKETPFPLI